MILTRQIMQLDLPREISTSSDKPKCAEVTDYAMKCRNVTKPNFRLMWTF